MSPACPHPLVHMDGKGQLAGTRVIHALWFLGQAGTGEGTSECQSHTSLFLRGLALTFSVACHGENKAQWTHFFIIQKSPTVACYAWDCSGRDFGSPTFSQWIRHWPAKAAHPTLVATPAQLQFHQ